jgi:hypothetical protein
MKSYVWQIWPTCQELSPMKQLTWRMARLLKLHPERDRRVRSVHMELFDSKRNKWVTITKQSIRHIARWKLCFIMQSKRLFRSKRSPRLLPRLLRPIVSIQTRLSICLKMSLLQCYMTLVITYLIDILPCNHCLFHIHWCPLCYLSPNIILHSRGFFYNGSNSNALNAAHNNHTLNIHRAHIALLIIYYA